MFGPNYVGESALKLAKKYHLDLSPSPIQATQTSLDAADLIVFVKNDVYQEAKNLFNINESKVIVWDVYDMYDYPKLMLPYTRRERSWQAIKSGVDELVKNLEKTSEDKK